MSQVIGLVGTLGQRIPDQRGLNNLLNMTDRELDDIGLSRGDLPMARIGWVAHVVARFGA